MVEERVMSVAAFPGIKLVLAVVIIVEASPTKTSKKTARLCRGCDIIIQEIVTYLNRILTQVAYYTIRKEAGDFGKTELSRRR